MSIATSYSCFGCVDYANNHRTRAYVRWACSMGMFTGDVPQLRWMCDCDEDEPDTPFVDPITDEACWYDPAVPESAEFLGIIVTGVGGIRNSSFERTAEDGLGGGSILSAPTIRGKELVFEAIIVATSCAGMDYGIEWMRRLFEDEGRCPRSGTSCSSCQGQVLTLRVHCPDDGHLDRGLRTFHSAGTIDGIDFVDDDYPMGQRNCCTMRRITWTVQTERAASYSTEPVGESTLTADDADVFQRLGNCPDTPEAFPCCPLCGETCDSCTTDPGCDCIPPFVLEPEVVSSAAPCFRDPVCRCIGAISFAAVPSGYETALRITLQAGWDPANSDFQDYGQRNTVIRIYENPDELPAPVDPDTYDAFTDRQLPCAELGVSWAPAGSELVIDGLTGQSWLTCDGRCVDHSSRVFSISGSLLPLVVRCKPIIVMVEWDCLTVQDNAVSPALPSKATVTQHLRHRL